MAQVFSPNLAQNFPFRVQIGLTYPRSPCGPLSGATDLPWAHLDLRYPIAGRVGLGAASPQGVQGKKSDLLPPLQIIALT